jgi:hypothetical protein
MKKSSYLNLFLNKDNKQDAEKMANFCTDNHSKKIKSGNELENFIFEDISNNTKINCLQNKKSDILNLKQKIDKLIINVQFKTNCKMEWRKKR